MRSCRVACVAKVADMFAECEPVIVAGLGEQWQRFRTFAEVSHDEGVVAVAVGLDPYVVAVAIVP